MICEFDNFLLNKNEMSVAFILDTITVSHLRNVILLKSACMVLSFERVSQKLIVHTLWVKNESLIKISL